MKATIVLALVGAVTAQQFGGQPDCATSCLASAISKVGCAATDIACQCGPTKDIIAATVGGCLISACTAARDLAQAISAGEAQCSSFLATASVTSGGSVTSSSAASSTSGSGSVASSTSSGSSLSSVSVSISSVISSITSAASSAASSGESSASSQAASSSSSGNGAAATPVALGAGALAAFFGAVAAL